MSEPEKQATVPSVDCRSGKLEDIETVKVCDDCNGEKFVTEQDYWDRAHCPKCDGKGVIKAR